MIIPWPFLSGKARQDMVHSPALRAGYIIMTSWHERRYLDNYWSDYHVSHIKQNDLMSAKQQKRPHVNSFSCIEMARHYKRVVKRKRYILWQRNYVLTSCYLKFASFCIFCTVSEYYPEVTKKMTKKYPDVSYTLQKTACRYLDLYKMTRERN